MPLVTTTQPREARELIHQPVSIARLQCPSFGLPVFPTEVETLPLTVFGRRISVPLAPCTRLARLSPLLAAKRVARIMAFVRRVVELCGGFQCLHCLRALWQTYH